MIKHSRFRILCALALCGLTVAQLHAQEISKTSLCDVQKAPASFDGQEVVVSGVAGNSFHWVDFWDPECGSAPIYLKFSDSYRMGQPQDKKYFHLLRKNGAVGITVKGKFVSSGGGGGPQMARFEILISSVVEVRELSKEYRQRFDIGSGKTTISLPNPTPRRSVRLTRSQLLKRPFCTNPVTYFLPSNNI